MNITGTVKNLLSSIVLNFVGHGRPDTVIFDYLYEYYCSVTHIWEKGIGQRTVLTGAVLRVQDQIWFIFFEKFLLFRYLSFSNM
jgi:hypothetical protein